MPNLSLYCWLYESTFDRPVIVILGIWSVIGPPTTFMIGQTIWAPFCNYFLAHANRDRPLLLPSVQPVRVSISTCGWRGMERRLLSELCNGIMMHSCSSNTLKWDWTAVVAWKFVTFLKRGDHRDTVTNCDMGSWMRSWNRTQTSVGKLKKSEESLLNSLVPALIFSFDKCTMLTWWEAEWRVYESSLCNSPVSLQFKFFFFKKIAFAYSNKSNQMGSIKTVTI